MISSLAHKVAETFTDPGPEFCYTASGYENEVFCTHVRNPSATLADGASTYNGHWREKLSCADYVE